MWAVFALYLHQLAVNKQKYPRSSHDARGEGDIENLLTMSNKLVPYGEKSTQPSDNSVSPSPFWGMNIVL